MGNERLHLSAGQVPVNAYDPAIERVGETHVPREFGSAIGVLPEQANQASPINTPAVLRKSTEKDVDTSYWRGRPKEKEIERIARP
jgi:hypothetical protein